jgi:hypothetical protein
MVMYVIATIYYINGVFSFSPSTHALAALRFITQQLNRHE